MPRLESHLNHREFKLKLELLIKNWKKRSSAEKKQATLAISKGLRNFATHAKFRRAANFHNLGILVAPVVDFFFCILFYLFQICPYVIVILFQYFSKFYMQYGIYARDKTL